MKIIPYEEYEEMPQPKACYHFNNDHSGWLTVEYNNTPGYEKCVFYGGKDYAEKWLFENYETECAVLIEKEELRELIQILTNVYAQMEDSNG